MSTYNLSLTIDSIMTITRMFLDVFIMWLLLYYVIKIVRNNSRTIQIFKGILLVVIVDGLAKFLGLSTVSFFADMFVNWGFLAIIIVFQPEIRSLLEKIGKSNVFSRITTLTGNEKEALVDQIVTATMLLSRDQTGALISIEQAHSLGDYIKTGTAINADVTAELLTSIFVTSTPLHDGAVIIQGDRIACASAYFPPTNLELPSRYGARHRAAIGISEVTDAVTIVVSEETGAVSITDGGKIISVNRKQLRDYLVRVICGEETEVKGTRPNRPVIIEDDLTQKGPVKKDSTMANDAYSIEPSRAAEATKKQDTSVISKLAIKKQAEIEEEKVKAESVIVNNVEQIKVNNEVVTSQKNETVKIVDDKKQKKNKKHRFSLFGNKEETKVDLEKEKMSELDKEEASIKLPKKKDRPIPSYPTHTAPKVSVTQKKVETPRVEVPVQPVKVVEEKKEVKETPTYTPNKVVRVMGVDSVSKPSESVAYNDNSTVKVEKPIEIKVNKPIEKAPVIEEKTPVIEEKTPVAVKDETAELDTSKINISSIMGFDSELEKSFEMVDGLKVVSKKDGENASNKGGEE